MSSQHAVCGECGSPEARAVGIDSVFCDDCRAVDLGTCVECGELAAETSHVTDEEIRPVCYACKSL